VYLRGRGGGAGPYRWQMMLVDLRVMKVDGAQSLQKQSAAAPAQMLEPVKARPAPAAVSKPATTPAASGGGDAMVTEWLKRKADQQRQAARDFLRKDQPAVGRLFQAAAAAAQATKTKANSPSDAQASAAVIQAAGGVVRQKVYSSGSLQTPGMLPSVAAMDGRQDSAGIAIQMRAASGGLVRGKVYNKAK
jgi:hypothetical protein